MSKKEQRSIDARLAGTVKWRKFGSVLHQTAARQMAAEINQPYAVIETRDRGGRVWTHRLKQVIRYEFEEEKE